MSQTRVLIIDDDRSLAWLLRQFLEKADYQVTSAEDGKAGLRALFEARPDLVVLDVMLPEMDGWQVCARIREVSDVPIIMLTAKSEEDDKLQGFDLGADDYVTKPFSFAELEARIGAVLSRTQRKQAQPDGRLYQADDLVIDLDAHRVSRGGNAISLTPTEFRLLQCFVENAGRVLSPEFLLERVWGPEYGDATGYIRRYVWYLRQKIELDPAQPGLILTEREFGYRLRKA